MPFNQPIFTDEELSEIFQIDFAEIFGSPEKPSKFGPSPKKPLKTVSKGSREKNHSVWRFCAKKVRRRDACCGRCCKKLQDNETNRFDARPWMPPVHKIPLPIEDCFAKEDWFAF